MSKFQVGSFIAKVVNKFPFTQTFALSLLSLFFFCCSVDCLHMIFRAKMAVGSDPDPFPCTCRNEKGEDRKYRSGVCECSSLQLLG